MSAALVSAGVNSVASLSPDAGTAASPVILARAVAFNPPEVQIIFPSVSRVCFDAVKPPAKPATKRSPAAKATPARCANLLLWQDEDPWFGEFALRETAYPVLLQPADAPKEAPAFFSTAIGSIAPDKDHGGKIRAFVDFQPATMASVQISVKGGEITEAVFVDAKPPGGYALRSAAGVVTLAVNPRAAKPAAVALDVSLRNLVPGETLVFSATASLIDGAKRPSPPANVAIKAQANAPKPDAR
jgi:hypothetical protein